MLAPLALLWVGARQVLDGGMSLGTMLALQALAAGVLAPLSSLVANGQRLQLVAPTSSASPMCSTPSRSRTGGASAAA